MSKEIAYLIAFIILGITILILEIRLKGLKELFEKQRRETFLDIFDIKEKYKSIELRFDSRFDSLNQASEEKIKRWHETIVKFFESVEYKMTDFIEVLTPEQKNLIDLIFEKRQIEKELRSIKQNLALRKYNLSTVDMALYEYEEIKRKELHEIKNKIDIAKKELKK